MFHVAIENSGLPLLGGVPIHNEVHMYNGRIDVVIVFPMCLKTNITDA